MFEAFCLGMIRVRQISGKELLALDAAAVERLVAKEGNSIRAVKRELQRLLGICIYRLKLARQGEMLKDDQTLTDLDAQIAGFVAFWNVFAAGNVTKAHWWVELCLPHRWGRPDDFA